MYFKTFVAVTAMAAATSLPLAVHAQDVHTLAPHFPDAFKVRTTNVSDIQITVPNSTGGSDTKSSHGSMSWTSDVHKTAGGYQGTLAIDSMDFGLPSTPPATTAATPPAAAATPPAPAPTGATATTTPGAAGLSATMNPADVEQKLTALLKLIGNPVISYDAHMRPVRIDNLDALKANVKNMILVAANTQDAPKISSMFDLFLNDITPESAASFLRQSNRSRIPFDKPLPLNTAVPLHNETMELYGATLTVGGTATLNSWEDGKAAHLTLVAEPHEADIHAFMDTLVDAFMKKLTVAMSTMGKAAKPEEMDQANAMIKRFIDNTVIHVASTCKMDVDLTNTALTHSDCTVDVYARIDASKFLTDEQLKADPATAAKLQAVTIAETVHSVTDTVPVN